MSSAATRDIAAIVVTYNRKALLFECIEALRGQTVSERLAIIVIDNASTDGTGEDFAPLAAEGTITYVNTGANLGGAGGFNYGIRYAAEHSYDYVWVMDDDCIPEPTALEELLNADKKVRGNYGFLSSKVLWKDGSICTMNIQRETVFKNVEDFNRELIPVEMASFVSFFVPTKVVFELGLPIKEFFIWTDDWEYTRRISLKYPCYLVTKSVVNHKSVSNIGANIATDTPERLSRFLCLYRNDVYLYRREGVKGFGYEVARLAGHTFRVLTKAKDNRLKRIGHIFKGTKNGFFFNPEIEFPTGGIGND